MGGATEVRGWRRPLAVMLIVVLVALSGVSIYAAVRYRDALERERDHAEQADELLTNQLLEYGQAMPYILYSAKTVEPKGRLSGADVGLYSARITGTSGDNGLMFDWVALDPNPHAVGRANVSEARQPLVPSPLAFVYVYGSLSDGSSEAKGLRPIGYMDFNRMLRKGDAASAALKESDWLVSVGGPEFMALVQVP